MPYINVKYLFKLAGIKKLKNYVIISIVNQVFFQLNNQKSLNKIYLMPV